MISLDRNQSLKQLLVPFTINLVVGLNLWARNCSSVIYIVISNTISVTQRRISNHTKQVLWRFFLEKQLKAKSR